MRRKYRLTIDRAEAAAVERILTGCPSTDLVRNSPHTRSMPAVALEHIADAIQEKD